jgi:hypothetical protein
MDDGDGAFTVELQAKKIADNATMYRGSSPCPQCGVIMDPVQFMYSRGLCEPCDNNRRAVNLKGRIV